MKTNEIWKDDHVLNLLIEQRSKVLRASNEHKEFSKKIKKRVIFLRNEKLAKEAHELNNYSNRRQVEELYNSFKSDHLTPSKNINPTRSVTQSSFMSISRNILQQKQLSATQSN